MRVVVLALLFQSLLVGCLSVTPLLAEYRGAQIAQRWLSERQQLCQLVLSQSDRQVISKALSRWQQQTPELLQQWQQLLRDYGDMRERQRQTRSYVQARHFYQSVKTDRESINTLCYKDL